MRIVLLVSFIVCSIFSLVTEFAFPQESTLQLILNLCSFVTGLLTTVFFILNETDLKRKIKEYYQYSFVKDDTIKKLEVEINHKNQVILDFQEEIEKNSSTPESAEELQKAKVTISNLNVTLLQKDGEINALKGEAERVNNSLTAASTSTAEHTEELEKTKQVMSELNSTLLQKESEINTLKLEVKNWCNKVEELNGVLSSDSEDAIFVDDNHIEDSEESDKTKEECLAFLEMIKWSNHNFNCSKCENTTYNTLDNLNSRKCTKCNHIESAMAHTLYMGVRFPLDKAFEMTKLVLTDPKISIERLMDETELTKNTCWKFKNKILDQKTAFKKKFKRDPEHWEELIYIK